MGITKKAKTSSRSTLSSRVLASRIARISSIASGSVNIENAGLPLHSSTPKKNLNTKQIFENFLKETKKTNEGFLAMLQEDLVEFESACVMLKLSIPAANISKPLKHFKRYREEFAVEEITDVSASENDSIVTKTDEQEDLLQFKKPTVPLATLVPSNRQRSSKMRTPNNRIPYIPTVITPKVNMNQPISVLRHARLGEQAVSLSGSPIMVSSVPREDTATVSVPIQDGRIVTILPTSEFNRDQMPSLDSETKSQLHTLYKNLATVFSEEDSELF